MKKLLLLIPLVLTGCIGQTVPKTSISGTMLGQPYSLNCPKDVTITNLEITASSNMVSVKIQGLSSKMNPDIITTTGDAQSKLISTAVAAGAAVAGQAAGAAK